MNFMEPRQNEEINYTKKVTADATYAVAKRKPENKFAGIK